MPELPEVEAVCQKLREQAQGERITAFHVLRPSILRPQSPVDFEPVPKRKIERIGRRAKNILIHLSGEFVVHVHLRMTGNLWVTPDIRFHPVDTRAIFEFANHRGLLFTDSRALGRVHLYRTSELDKLFADLGPEPLGDDFTPETFITAAQASRLPAKLFLMDQSKIAGLGNIYAAEALFRARIHPVRVIARVSRTRLAALHGAIVQVLRDAVQSASNAYSGPGRVGEAETFPRYVYDREGEACRNCGRPIRRIAQGGRSTYYCPGCQK